MFNKNRQPRKGYVLATVLILVTALSLLLLGIYSVTVRYLVMAKKATADELAEFVYKDITTGTETTTEPEPIAPQQTTAAPDSTANPGPPPSPEVSENPETHASCGNTKNPGGAAFVY